MSAPNAKFPLPTCNGVELELTFLFTFKDLTIRDLRLHGTSAFDATISSKNSQRTFSIMMCSVKSVSTKLCGRAEASLKSDHLPN